MAITVQKSAQVQQSEAEPNRPVDVADWTARARRMFAAFVQATEAGDAGSSAELVVMPAGSKRLYLDESLIYHSAMGAARVMSIGHTGYTQPDGTVVAANSAAFSSGNDVSAAGTFKPTGVNGRTEAVRVDSRGPVTITATVTGGTLDIGEEIDGYFCYGLD